MEQLFAALNFKPINDWEAIAEETALQRGQEAEQDQQYAKYIEFSASKDADEESFKIIESNTRVSLLRTLRMKPVIAQQQAPAYSQAQPQQGYQTKLSGKKAKNQNNREKTVVVKTKFTELGSIKSEWIEMEQFQIGNLGKSNLEVRKTVLTVPEGVPKFVQNLQLIRTNKPASFAVNNVDETRVRNINKDDGLDKLVREQVVAEGDFAFYMPEHVFLCFASINRRDFPFNINFLKEGRKFIFSTELNKNNVFVICKTFNETAQKLASENEDELARLSFEANAIDDEFVSRATERKPTKFGAYEVTIGDNLHIYTELRHDAVDEDGSLMQVRSFNDDGQYWKNIESKWDDVVGLSMRNNAARLIEWIVAGAITGAQKVAIGYVSRIQADEPSRHHLLKVEKRQLDEFSKFLNFSETDCYLTYKAILETLAQIEDDGKYVIHKIANKNAFKLFKVPQRDL